ncbi:hypothetical protein ATANTOWER_012909 [Ataeniobius toweri]|uniref:Uncharacterized protein n=1 Tax=Ataeniobius toweri TaxID=208326 RepID=A0ABU7AXM9_9TELE|nr:hypothetical protein [Ataeniobius toweri]
MLVSEELNIFHDVLIAVGRQRGLDVSNIVQFPTSLMAYFTDEGRMCGQQLSCPNTMISTGAILFIFNLQIGGKSSKLLLAKSAEQIIKTGFKTALSGGIVVSPSL